MCWQGGGLAGIRHAAPAVPLRTLPRHLIVGGLRALWHVPTFALNVGMQALGGPVLLSWALLWGAIILASLCPNLSQGIMVVAVWHATVNTVVATDAGVGTLAAVVSTLVMNWGVGVALWWWRSDWLIRSRPT